MYDNSRYWVSRHTSIEGRYTHLTVKLIQDFQKWSNTWSHLRCTWKPGVIKWPSINPWLSRKMKKKQLKLAKVVNVLGNMRKNPEILAYLIGSWPGAPQVYIINNDVSHLSSFCCLASYHPPGVADNSSLKKPRRFFAGFINHPLIVFSTLSPQSRQQQ